MADTRTITTLLAAGGRRLLVGWSDGIEHDLDLSGRAEAPPDDSAFAQAEAGPDGVRWPAGGLLTAAELWDLGLAQAADRLVGWRSGHHLTQTQACAILGITDRMLRNYEKRAYPIPRSILLALDGYDARLGLPVRPAPERSGTPARS
ncbi:hypothetical protein [Azospirillum sp. TSH64]|uniref:hypothetical protein n=1 Tax=Azospirillum sp. TSH64 TaxID=652740 RepID=UPI000D622203|nr:hypothetical protein [Azospirillum sp. TSH64]PWC74043.1 hypothetical protein TSH64_02540 [Azospirillum sp. TSH64]